MLKCSYAGWIGSALLVGLRMVAAAPASPSVQAPPFAEVLDLVRSKQQVYSAEQLNQMAVDGFVQRLGGLARFSDEAVTLCIGPRFCGGGAGGRPVPAGGKTGDGLGAGTLCFDR